MSCCNIDFTLSNVSLNKGFLFRKLFVNVLAFPKAPGKDVLCHSCMTVSVRLFLTVSLFVFFLRVHLEPRFFFAIAVQSSFVSLIFARAVGVRLSYNEVTGQAVW